MSETTLISTTAGGEERVTQDTDPQKSGQSIPRLASVTENRANDDDEHSASAQDAIQSISGESNTSTTLVTSSESSVKPDEPEQPKSAARLAYDRGDFASARALMTSSSAEPALKRALRFDPAHFIVAGVLGIIWVVLFQSNL